MTPSSLALTALLLAFPAALQAGDREFDRIVDGLENHYGTRPLGTGFLGFMARCFSPPGIHDLRMAIFEDVDTRVRGDIDDIVRRAVGGATPIVQVTSRRGEHTYIYLTGGRDACDLLVVCAEPKEAVVLNMRLDPGELARWMNDPSGMVHRTRGKEGHRHGSDEG